VTGMVQDEQNIGFSSYHNIVLSGHCAIKRCHRPRELE